MIIQTVTAEHSEASSTRKPYSLDFVKDSDKLFFELTCNFEQGRVDIALYDEKGKHLCTQGAAGWFNNYFGIPDGRIFEKEKPFNIEVIEKDVIGSYKFEVAQLPPFTITGWLILFMLFASFITSSLALLILGWWMYSQRCKNAQASAHSPA
ncbi:MAG: hypothetical protein HOC20_14195 [Chloroflexi bacterium]|nr:hypothetical protein [Chloroflexota bacterium]